ncbi:MAG TPA: RNA methyltransferase [Longimicrobiales bacterium]|nr:RNA methyltransferase [Longimicrobiales bacterium]
MLTKADTKLIHALKSRSGREKHGLFPVEGVRVAEDLLTSDIDLEFAVIATTLGDTPRGQAMLEQLKARTAVREVDERALAQVAETETPQGVLVIAHIPQATLDQIELAQDAIMLVLDAVQDPGNLGTLIRSANAFGAAAVVALPGTTDFWSSKVVRSAAGSAFSVPLVNAGEEEIWRWLARHDVVICGADMKGTSVDSWVRAGRTALVVGNEGAGLRDATRAHVTQLVSIPMRGQAESLNVAVAAGILLYEFSRHR